MKYSKTEITSYKDFSLTEFQKTPKNSHNHSWTIKIYSRYMYINKTSYDLDLSGLKLGKGENRYFSKKQKVIQARLNDSLGI